MLKIKFNINEFTIIFLRRFEGKNERKRIFSVSFLLHPSFLLQHSFFLFFCFSPLSCFCLVPFFFLFLFSTLFLVKRLLFASFSASFLLSSCSPTFFSFLFDVLPYFFSPNTFSAQNFFQPSSFYLWFSASFFSSF